MRTTALVILVVTLGACASSTPVPVSIDASPSNARAPSAPTASVTAAAPPKPSATVPAASKPASADARVHLGEVHATGLAETTQVAPSMRPGIVQCFDAALKNEATMAGKLVVHVKLDPTGKVAGVKFDDEIGLDVTLAGCLVNAVRATSYPPAPSGAVLKVPLSVTP
ncbi:Hypothetical protein A7982_02780 [Minicystis rosea]|nr:Hypothetical protein A7982_02780 [Minicystis rosea]